MEIEQLRHFVKVAELENFTRAAEHFGLSQSALSRSIARLEEELGQPVLERQTRKVSMTDAGRLLFDRALKILMMVEDLKAEIVDDGESGRVRVGAIPTVAPYFLPEILRSFQRGYPRAQLVVQEDTTESLVKRVADGDVDLAIAALPTSGRYIDIEPLFEEELFLVTSAEHPLARQPVISAHDLEEIPFILLGEAHCLAENVLSFCRRQTINPVSVERTSQLAMVQELVTLGHGVSLIPAMARARDASDLRVYRSLAEPRPTRVVVLVTNPYRFRSRLVSQFREHLRHCVQNIRPTG